jgi:glucosamine--fructose-6-phosphate aminotransferase (isomerizing)
MGPEDLLISLTQSGETTDTLAAMEGAASRGVPQIVITNAPGSQATRIADATMEIRAGLEVGVAATKTFTSSIVSLHLLALHLGAVRNTLSTDELAAHLRDLGRLPQLTNLVLERRGAVEALAAHFLSVKHFLFLGRGLLHPVALEGALKLKEVSYLHAEGHAAGEMKHGPIALIGPEMPTMALAPHGALREKMASNIAEIQARNGTVIGVLTDGDQEMADRVNHALFLPDVPSSLLPVVATVPMQLFAYHMGVERGADVDQPRHLAKSVTVE